MTPNTKARLRKTETGFFFIYSDYFVPKMRSPASPRPGTM